MGKIAITGGKEETPKIEFVPSNYHGKKPWEKLVIIEGACSSDTLREIARMLDEENSEAFIRFQICMALNVGRREEWVEKNS